MAEPSPVTSESPENQSPSRSSATIAIVATLLLGGAALCLLVYRAITSPAPERVLVIRASSEWEGTELVVTGGTLAHPTVGIVRQAGSFVVPFFLASGQYHLSVRSQSVEVWQQDFDLRNDEEHELDLTRTGASTRPATTPSETAKP